MTTPPGMTYSTTPINTSYAGQIVENLDLYVTSGPAIIIDQPNVIVRNVIIHNANGNCINVSDANNVTISNALLVNSDPPAGQSGENESFDHTAISVDGSSGLHVDHVTMRDADTGILLNNSPNATLSNIEGYNFRGPFPGGQMVQFVNSPNGTLSDFYALNEQSNSHPEDVISVIDSTNVHVTRGVIDGDNSPSGVGVMYEGNSQGGTVDYVDAVHMGNGAFSSYSDGVHFDHVRSFDNIATNQGRGVPLSGGLIFADIGNDVTFTNSTYTRAATSNIAWSEADDTISVANASSATPQTHISNVFPWDQASGTTPGTGSAINGTSGNDTITGGNGADTIFAGQGSDFVTTGNGGGVIVGGNDSTDGADSLTSGTGNDLIYGNGGDDTIGSGGGNDIAVGGTGNDRITLSGGNDQVYGNEGGDTIQAGAGQNNVCGGQGNDSIASGAGADLLYGNEGSDTIDAGEGNNTMAGGQDSTDGADLLTAGAGNDLIYGNGGDDSIDGGGGRNDLVGGVGSDTISAGAGNDALFGNQGNDVLNAGDGANLVFGGLGNDAITTGSGNDTIWGNEGNDTLIGGGGADRYAFAAGSGSDLIQGFSATQGDRLDLQGQTYLLGSAAGGDALLTLSGGGSITLAGITAQTFQSGFVL